MQKLLFLLVGGIIGSIFALILLRQDFQRDHTPLPLPLVPVCDSLPARGPDNVVAVFVGRIATHPGMVCARLHNGTQETINYGLLSLRLERRWLGIVWSSALRLRDLLPGDPRIAVKLPLFMLRPGEGQDKYVTSLYGPAPPGTYRVRLHYRVYPEEDGLKEDERTAYSEAVVLP